VTVDNETARVLDLDPTTRADVAGLLDRLTSDERAAADALRGEIEGELGSFLREPGSQMPSPPTVPDSAWVAGMLAAAPAVSSWMRDRGISESVVSATLADVGRQLRLHHQHTGRTGFDVPIWMFAVLSGSLYQLGRLQFDLRRWRPGEIRPAGDTGPWVLDVHIPASGPLTPATVTESFDRAVAFFGEHFPEQRIRFAVCASWLLDPTLGEHLSQASNMVAFQRQFVPYGEPQDDELDAVYFTFGQRSLDNLDRLPRSSSLQRLVLNRLQSGERWHVVRGYRELSPRIPSAR